jgi:hypothetical protein
MKGLRNLKSMKNRKTLLTLPAFQLRFIGFMGLVGLFNFALFLAIHEFFFSQFRQLGEEFSLPSDSPFFQFIHRQHSMSLSFFLLAALVNLALVIFLGLLFSHRICGPLVRIQKTLAKLPEELPDPIRLRNTDYFPELADSLNQVITRLKKSKTLPPERR